MSDTIGRITIPDLVSSGLTFPLKSDFGFGFTQDQPIVTHRFGDLDTKCEQRYKVGIGPRKHAFKRANLSLRDRNNLATFWETIRGSLETFTYNVPNADQTTTPKTVTWEQAPLSFEYLQHACRVGFNFLEAPGSATSYTVASTCTRFPSTTLASSLTGQVQELIPLIHIRVRESAVPDIYLSDRRCIVGGQLYLPRVLGLGEPGSDVLLSQDINGTADGVKFTLGNADGVMTALANDTDLKFATIDLCFYDVTTGILLQLWKGNIQNFTIDGSPHFTIQASDGAYQTTLAYPNAIISRQCRATFNDGILCPWSTAGGIGDSTKCDYYWNSVNGCVSHGMQRYFRGIPILPQSVNIKDNSTGFLGFNRNSVQATSIVSDTMWGKALADIWCNNGGVPSRSFQQNCIIAAVRDNGDFFDVLGIVGRGPLGAYAIGGNASGSFVTNSDGFTFLLAPLADGWPAHGLKIGSNGVSTSTNSALGLRQVPGWGFILGSGDQRYNQFGLYNIVGNVPVDKTYTPDTAFCELLYQKPSGMNPSSADTHTMVVPIAQGLTGFLWDASDVRSSFGGLTNPFWIAINTYLRGMGLETADAATQLDTFVRPSVFAGDGTGCAEIADDLAAAILGAGMETQFSFQGTVDTQKPLRDWLREILNTGLGYYTWEFGKLKLGTRINASAVDSYTAGSMKFQSLRLTPIEAAFEKMILDFADVQYQWQANTAEYSDKDHAAYYGRSGAPLTARMHSLGAPTLSQNLRLAAVRTREEIGGVNATEWKNARNAYWETTLLGLSNEVGQVVSITDAKIPGGTGKFRINRWELRKDYSIALYGKTVTDSMYDLTVGPKPVDVTPQPLPVLVYPIPSGPAWAPCQVQAPSWDALFPGEWNFDSNQTYTTLADGSVNANLVITGKLPVNQYAPGVSAPSIGTISQTTTGGSLPASTMLRVALCVLDSSGRPSPSSAIALINTSASGTDTFTLSNISWPAVSGLASWVLFVSAHDDTICAQASGSLTATGGGTTYTPTSITFAGPVTWSTWALPSPYTKRLRIKAKLGGHLGIMGVLVDSVTSTTVTCAGLIDTSGAPPNLVGRVLSVIGRNGANTPYLSVSITAYNPTTGTLTVSPHATVSGQPSQSIAAGDIVIVRMKPDAPNTSNPTQVTDSGWLNSQTGDFSGGSWPGLNPGTEVGDILRVIQGTGRGQLRKLTGNTTTGFSWDLPLLLDTTSVFIIEKPTWDYVSDSTDISNADYSHGTTLTVAATNFINRSIVVAGFTVDSSGNESPDGDGPIREDWIFGSQGASNVAGFTLQADGTLGVQSDAAPAFYLNDPFVPGAVKAYLKSAPTGADFTFTLNAGATTWMTLTIPAGSTSVTATSAQLTAAGTIPANTNVRLDITAVGTTFPGSDLSIFIYS